MTRADKILKQVEQLATDPSYFGSTKKVWAVQVDTSGDRMHLGPFKDEDAAVSHAAKMTRRNANQTGIVYTAVIVDPIMLEKEKP